MNNKEDIIYFSNAVKLSVHILKKNYIPCELQYNVKYSLDDIIQIVSEFLKDISIDLYNEFASSYKNNLELVSLSSENNRSYYNDENENINVVLHNTLADAFDIVHEFLHSQNAGIGKSETCEKFTEYISILGEFMLSEYLENKGFDETGIAINNRILWTYNDALELLVLNQKLASKDEDWYERFLLRYPGANLTPETYHKIRQKKLNIITDSRYVMGTFLATYSSINYSYPLLKLILVELNKRVNAFKDKDLYEFLSLNLCTYENHTMFDQKSLLKLHEAYDTNCELNTEKMYTKRID